MHIRLGTRASALALVQSRSIAKLLEKTHRGLTVELVEISTTGDRVRDKALKSFGGAGVFVKELEQALISKEVDVAVHSLKDMPTRQPRGLTLGAIVGREDPRDVAIISGAKSLAELPAGSVVGSGSTRRRAQLKMVFPQLEFAEIRGNVETRIRKVLEQHEFAATILARAGLKRLGLLDRAAETIPLAIMLPAPGQGALGIECRSRDSRVLALLKKIHNADVAACVIAERTALEALGGGCHLPLGALGTVKHKNGRRQLHLRAALGMPDGSWLRKTHVFGGVANPVALGKKIAKLLLDDGGKAMLRQLNAIDLPKS